MQDIYKNLIDEDDIIIEEGSLEGVSRTFSADNMAKLKGNSTNSNHTGYEMQKIMDLIKQTSSSDHRNKRYPKITNSY